MNMRKIIAVLVAVLMLCAVVPMGVFAAPGDVVISKNFDDGSVFSNARAENGYMVFDATTADWANVYMYANALKNATKYEITFDCMANKATNINVKINNNWSGDTFKWTTNVTTEWETYSCVITTNELKELTSTALLMFTSNTYASSGAVYHIDNVVVKEYTDPATIGQVTNGDFESGNKTGWDGSATVVSGGYNSNYAAQLLNPGQWASALTQTIPVEANTDYEITWMSKRVSGSGAFNLIVCQSVSPWTNFTKVSGQNWMNETSGNWVTNTYTVNTGSNTSMLLKFTTEATNPGEILLDNIVVSKVKEPSFDGFIKNGDFETGKATPWTVYSGTAVSADAAKDGDYGLYIKNPTGGWGGTAYQNFTTEAGKTYVVMMDAKAISNGQNIQIKDNGTTKASKWFTTTSWTTLSFEYTATSTAGTINICGGGTGGNEEIYVDNIFVFEKKAASNDGYVVNGDFETGTTEGLSPSQSTCVSRDAAKDGNFGLKMMGNGGWGGVGLWTINGLEVGATYKFEMDMNAVEQGFNWTLWQTSTSSGTKYASGYFSTKAWTHIEKEFVANDTVAVLNINGGGNGNAETVYLDNLKVTLVKPAHTCEFVGVETLAPTCENDGVMTYSCTCGEGTYTEAIPATGHTAGNEATCEEAQTCSACGAELSAALGHNYSENVTPPTCTEDGLAVFTCENCGDTYEETIPAEHTYTDDCDSECDVCGEWRFDAPHYLTYVPGVVPTSCLEQGYDEYWECTACGAYFGDAEASWQVNPAWMYYTGDCVRPEGAIPCAVVPCEICGNDTYGDACTRPENAPACQDAECVYCGELIWGEGHSYGYDEETWESLIPLCQPGDCIHCGVHLDYIYECENGSWAPCSYDGECCYGCGKQYPATGEHAFDDGVTACDGGMCWLCWEEIAPADHVYDDDFDTDCNVCGAVRELSLPIASNGASVSEDANGLAVRFEAEVNGLSVLGSTNIASYTNAYLNGYKLVEMGAEVYNGFTTLAVKAVYLTSLEETSAGFAVRVINIPERHLTTAITYTPYYIVEMEGVQVTLYGTAFTGSYSEYVPAE